MKPSRWLHSKCTGDQAYSAAICQAYLAAMLMGFPLYFQNNYINLTAAKKSYFQTATLVFFALIFACRIYQALAARQQEARNRQTFHLGLPGFFAFAFFWSILFSSILSPAWPESFLGREGRQMGGLFLALCILAFFAVSYSWQRSAWLPWLLPLSCALTFGIVICNFYGWDLLGMHQNLAKSQQPTFLGTMGNTNINAGYGGVMCALLLALSYIGKQIWLRRCCFAASAFGIYACYGTASDSWLLAVCGALLVILAHSMGDPARMYRWWGCCLAFFLGGAAMMLTLQVGKGLGKETIYMETLQSQGILQFLTGRGMLLAQACLLLLILWGIRTHTALMAFLQRHGNKLLLLILLAALLLAAFLIFPLPDSFGTNRGYIWKRTLSNFSHLPIWQKLLGYGPNCFFQSMEARYGAEMIERYTYPFLDAHNEALQFLAVTGVFGAASYFGMQLSLLASCLRRWKQNPVSFFGVIGISAYLLQGLANNPSVFATPLYFIFLGVIAKSQFINF